MARLNPFLGLLAVSLALGVAAGMPFSTILRSFETGLGNTPGPHRRRSRTRHHARQNDAESGGAASVADALIKLFGPRRVPWAMMAIGFLVGLPVFFEVGFVLLIPIAFTVARRTGTSLVLVALPCWPAFR